MHSVTNTTIMLVCIRQQTRPNDGSHDCMTGLSSSPLKSTCKPHREQSVPTTNQPPSNQLRVRLARLVPRHAAADQFGRPITIEPARIPHRTSPSSYYTPTAAQQPSNHHSIISASSAADQLGRPIIITTPTHGLQSSNHSRSSLGILLTLCIAAQHTSWLNTTAADPAC